MTNKSQLGQSIADFIAKIIRSWTFVFCQLGFILWWIFVNRFSHQAWDNGSFDLLKLVLAIEWSLIVPILLMSWRNQSDLDRKVVFNNYCLDLQTKEQLKEMKPMLEKVGKLLGQKKLD